MVKAGVTQQDCNGSAQLHFSLVPMIDNVLSCFNSEYNYSTLWLFIRISLFHTGPGDASGLYLGVTFLHFLAKMSCSLERYLRFYCCLPPLKSWRIPLRWRGSSQSRPCPWKGDAAGPSLSASKTRY